MFVFQLLAVLTSELFDFRRIENVFSDSAHVSAPFTTSGTQASETFIQMSSPPSRLSGERPYNFILK